MQNSTIDYSARPQNVEEFSKLLAHHFPEEFIEEDSFGCFFCSHNPTTHEQIRQFPLDYLRIIDGKFNHLTYQQWVEKIQEMLNHKWPEKTQPERDPNEEWPW